MSSAHVVDQVEAARAVEAEHELALLVLAERVLELVAVAQALLGRHDRLDRRGLEAADPLERVAHLSLLLRELALVGEHLPGRARVRRHRLDRSGLGSSSSTESASANERFDLVTRAARGRPARRRARTRRSPLGARDTRASVGEAVDAELSSSPRCGPGTSVCC